MITVQQSIPRNAHAQVLLCVLWLLILGHNSYAQASVAALDTPMPLSKESYDDAIATPASVLGFPVGSQAASYEQVNTYTQLLERASRRVTRTRYGRSHEGRDLYYLTITDPANHQRLGAIQTENARLADPRQESDPAAGTSRIEDLPAVAWLNYSIHGDELSSTDAALIVAYHLSAAKDPETRNLLRDTVIHLVPLVNPDGRERFLGQIRQFTGSVSPPDGQAMHHAALWTRGRGNHYLFDLNRDWLILEQPEVRDLAAVYKTWNAHLLVDSHEMGSDDTYLFDPPNRPHNLHLAESTLRWRTAFGADQAQAFDRHGWSYYTRDWYTDWAPIYTNSWASLRDAVGLLYEQARANASAILQPNGRIMPYRDTVHHHVVSCLANLGTLHANRRTILEDFAATRRTAVTTKEGPRVFLLPPHPDRDRWQGLVNLLRRQGIEVDITRQEVTARQVTDLWDHFENTRSFPSGTAVVRSNQPLRNLLLTLLEFDPHLTDDFLLKERKELERYRRTRMYDTSTWNLPMAYGLPSFWAQDIDAVTHTGNTVTAPVNATLPAAQYGYLLDGQRWDTARALVRLYEQDRRVRMATLPFRIGDQDFGPGTLLLRCHENEDDLPVELDAVARSLNLTVHALNTARVQDGDDLGGRRFQLLTPPRTALCTRWPISTTSFGSLWYLLDHQAGLPCSPVNLQALGKLDLRRYNVLVLPEGDGLERLMDASLRDRLAQWVQDGGTLIAVGQSAAFLAQNDLSAVRLKRDVLEELDVYAEALRRERDARDIQVDARHIWETPPQADPNTAETKPTQEGDGAARQRRDEWQRVFRPSGVFLAGQVDTEHWLAAGLDETMPVYFRGGNVLMSRHPVETVIRLAPAAELRLSGLLWPEARERIANAAYVTVERKGRGQVILFAADPSFRMWFPGLQRLLLNAVLLGPGMGTDQPRRW